MQIISFEKGKIYNFYIFFLVYKNETLIPRVMKIEKIYTSDIDILYSEFLDYLNNIISKEEKNPFEIIYSYILDEDRSKDFISDMLIEDSVKKFNLTSSKYIIN